MSDYERYLKLEKRQKALEELYFEVIKLFQEMEKAKSTGPITKCFNRISKIVERIDKLPGPHDSKRADTNQN